MSSSQLRSRAAGGVHLHRKEPFHVPEMIPPRIAFPVTEKRTVFAQTSPKMLFLFIQVFPQTRNNPRRWGCPSLPVWTPCLIRSHPSMDPLLLPMAPEHTAVHSTEGPWPVWLSGLSDGLQTKGSLVRFPVRAHAWVMGQVPSGGHMRGIRTLMFLPLSFSLTSTLSKNK